MGAGESFVARIWLENHSNGDPLWRGHIRHIQSGEERHFGSLGEMREFVERLTGVVWAGATRSAGDESNPAWTGRRSKGNEGDADA